MSVRTLCLSILYDGEATGYEIRKASTEGKFAYFVEASFGAIYPALARLEADKLVTSRDEVQSGKPSRKIYSITEAGRQALLDTLRVAPAEDIFRSEFLLIATFAPILGRAHIGHVLDDRIAWTKREMEKLQSYLEACGEPATRWTIEYGLNCHRAGLNYLVDQRAALEAVADGRPGAEAATEPMIGRTAAE